MKIVRYDPSGEIYGAENNLEAVRHATPAIVNNILLTANWQKVSEKLTKSVKNRDLWKLQVSIEGLGLSVPWTDN